MIRGIIFDCFGVLYGGSLEALCERCPPEKLDDLRDLNKQGDYGFISGEEYVAGLARLLDVPLNVIIDLLRQKHIRNQPLIEFVRTLRPHYKVGLLSNVSSGTIDPLLTPEERAQLFDAEVLSYKESLAKPNPDIFRLMAERLGLPTSECVMIDDLAENCDSAEIAGMQSIQHITNTTTINTLHTLLDQDSA